MDNLPNIEQILVLGDIMRDIIILPEGEMVRGSDVRAEIRRLEGGAGANQAMWLSKNNLSVKFIARVGKKDFEYYRTRFLSNNIEPILQQDMNEPTGRLATLVDAKTGERSFFTDRGANRNLAQKEIPKNILDNISLLQISGYAFFEPSPRKAALELIKQAKSKNIPLSIDPASSAFIEQVGADKFLGWIRGAKFIFPNEEEAKILSGFNEPKQQIDFLGDYFDFIILKRAQKGAIIGTKRNGIIANVKAPKIRAIDSSGAGDAFLGGFFGALKKKKGLNDCLKEANIEGAIAAAQIGGQPK